MDHAGNASLRKHRLDLWAEKNILADDDAELIIHRILQGQGQLLFSLSPSVREVAAHSEFVEVLPHDSVPRLHAGARAGRSTEQAGRQSKLEEIGDEHQRSLNQGWIIFQRLQDLHLVFFVSVFLFMVVLVSTFTQWAPNHKRLSDIVVTLVVVTVVSFLSFTVSFIVSWRERSLKTFPYSAGNATTVEILQREAGLDRDKYFAVASFIAS